MKDRRILGIILIAIGAVSMAARFGWLSGDYMLMGLGAVFLAGYYLRGRPIGFLVPACVLLAIGLFSNVQSGRWFHVGSRLGGALFFFFMALAFFMVQALHRLGRGDREKKLRWPAIVGTALAAFGVFVYGAEHWNLGRWLAVAGRFWPLVLVAVGLYMIFSNTGGDGRS